MGNQPCPAERISVRLADAALLGAFADGAIRRAVWARNVRCVRGHSRGGVNDDATCML
jgi:hypothetical protein